MINPKWPEREWELIQNKARFHAGPRLELPVKGERRRRSLSKAYCLLAFDAHTNHRGGRHSNVLRAYDNLKLKCPDEFMRRNFAPYEFIDERGNTQRSVTMTKDGLSMLATGFTGPKAMVLMEAYIAAFNAMTEISPTTNRTCGRFTGRCWKKSTSRRCALRSART